MTRRPIADMPDDELAAERRKLAAIPGKSAARRYARLLNEEVRREAQRPGA